MSTNLKRLVEITPGLPELNELEVAIGGPVVGFKRRGGTLTDSFGFGVYRDEMVGMMRSFMPCGAVIDAHQHQREHEWLGVIKGEVEIIFMDTQEKIRLRDCEVLHIAPGRPHLTIALKDTWGWGVTIPPAAGYPDVTGCPFAASAQRSISK